MNQPTTFSLYLTFRTFLDLDRLYGLIWMNIWKGPQCGNCRVFGNGLVVSSWSDWPRGKLRTESSQIAESQKMFNLPRTYQPILYVVSTEIQFVAKLPLPQSIASSTANCITIPCPLCILFAIFMWGNLGHVTTLPYRGPWHPWQGQHRTITQVFNSAPSASESFVSTELRQRLIPLYLSTPQDMGMDGICVQYHRVYMFVRGQIPECSLNGSYLMTQVFKPRNGYSPNQKSKEIRSCQATLHTLLVLLMIISNFIHWFIHSLSMSSLVCLGNISGF